MLSVDIGIGHQHDLVIAGLGDVEVLADTGAERLDHRLHFLVRQRLVQACALDVEDLAAQREDRLRVRIPALHGRTTGGVALHEEDLADRGVFARAVLELVGHRSRLEDALAARSLTSFARCHAGAGGVDRLADDVLRLLRIPVEPVAELVTHDLLHERPRFRVAELGLGLALELRLGQLHGDDGGESLTDVLTGEVVILLLQHVLRTRVAVDQRGQSRPEAFLVRAALVRVDRVGEGEDVLGVARRPLHRHLHGDLAVGVLRLEIDDLVVDDLGVTHLVEVLHVVDQAPLVEEAVVTRIRRLGSGAGLDVFDVGLSALVAQVDTEALVQEGHLLEPGAQRVVVELDRVEDVGIGPERDGGSGQLAVFALLQRGDGLSAVAIGLSPYRSLPVHLDLETVGQRIDDG